MELCTCFSQLQEVDSAGRARSSIIPLRIETTKTQVWRKPCFSLSTAFIERKFLLLEWNYLLLLSRAVIHGFRKSYQRQIATFCWVEDVRKHRSGIHLRLLYIMVLTYLQSQAITINALGTNTFERYHGKKVNTIDFVAERKSPTCPVSW